MAAENSKSFQVNGAMNSSGELNKVRVFSEFQGYAAQRIGAYITRLRPRASAKCRRDFRTE
jgi:hypothetical protein